MNTETNDCKQEPGAVVPRENNGMLTCPMCGEGKQPLNRNCCWKCGAVFSGQWIYDEAFVAPQTATAVAPSQQATQPVVAAESSKDTRYFCADEKRKAEVEKKKSAAVKALIANPIAIPVWLLLRASHEVVLKISLAFGKSPDTIRSWFLAPIFIHLILLLWAVCLTIVKQRQLSRLENSKLKVDQDGVSGTCFAPESMESSSFFVPYKEIQHAKEDNSRELNLSIFTQTGCYRCLAIRNAKQAAAEINKRVEETRALAEGDTVL